MSDGSGNAGDLKLWGFPIDVELYRTAHQTIARIRAKEHKHSSANLAASEVVSRLTAFGLQHYYQIPIDSVPMAPRMRRMADSGINVVMAAINMVIRQFFKNRSDDELLEMASYLEPMLWVNPQSGQPYLVFALEPDLYQRAQVLIERVRTDQNTQGYIDEVVDTLCELVAQGVHYYYHAPSDLIGLKGLSRKTVDVGIHNAQKGIRLLIEKLVREVPHRHLVDLSYHIESMIHPFQTEEGSKATGS